LLALDKPNEALEALDAINTSPHVAYERARAKLLLGDLETGWSDMQLVIAAPQSLGAALFAFDSDGMLDSLSRAQLDQASADQMTATLVKAWSRLAARSGTSVPEMLAEHFRRLQYANANYYEVPSQHKREELYALPSVTREDRWTIYVRYGEPFEIIQNSDEDFRYITWVYPSPNSKKGYIFHFKGVNAKFFFMDAAGCGAWLDDRARLRSDLAQLYNACSDRLSSRPYIVARNIQKALIGEYKTAIRTGSVYSAFRESLDFTFSINQFRNGSGLFPDVVRGRYRCGSNAN
jgi:GWxTD domain-containing protein